MGFAIFAAIVASIIVAFFMYLDSRIFDSPKSSLTYIKNMVLCGSLVFAFTYMVGGAKTLPEQTGAGYPTSFIGDINQEIFSHGPDF